MKTFLFLFLFAALKDNALLIQSRYYFFEKNGRLYFLSFTAGKANDNLQIEKAIESAVKM